MTTLQLSLVDVPPPTVPAGAWFPRFRLQLG